MSKFRTSILIVGMLVIIVAASLLTVFALYITGAVVTDKIELVYSVFDAEKVYDGTPLNPARYELVSGELLQGHYAVVDFEGSQIDAGTSKSSISVKICDKDGYDVTSEYKIGVNRGNLKVLPREIEVVLGDQEVTYNGTKVSFENYTVTQGSLIDGHKIAGSQNAQLITVNDSLPTDLKPIVYDLVGNDVTKNYEVHFTMGNIRVVPRPVSVKPVSVTKVYDGKQVKLGEVEIYEGSLAEGQYFKNVEINYGTTEVGASVCDVVTRITRIGIFQLIGSQEVEVTENYDLDYMSETGAVVIEKRPLTITAKSRTWTYDGAQHDLTGDHSPLSYSGLAPGELLLEVDYSGDITNVGEATNYISRIHLSENASESNYEILYITGTLTVAKRNVTITTPTVSREYNGEPLRGDYGGFPTGKDILDDHIIMPDTEEMPELIDCGTITNQFACKIVNKEGAVKTDYTENYNITYIYGNLSVTKRSAQVLTPTVSAAFDGEVHYGFETKEDIETDNFLADHEIVVPQGDRRPSRVDVGISYNSFKVTVRDAEGFDVTQNYDIDYSYGNIEITRLIVTVSTGEASKEYDGEELEMGEEDTKFGDLPAGLTAVLASGQSYPKITEVSKTRNEVLYKLTKDGSDVAESNYRIDYDYGWLEITPCVVRIRLKNITQTYSGDELEISVESALEDITLPTGLKVEDFKLVKSEETIKDAGTYIYTVELNEKNPNYDLNITDGNITVNKLKITVALPEWREGITEEFTYDGTSKLPTVRNAVSADYLIQDVLGYNDFVILPVSGDFINASSNVYRYTAQIVTEQVKNIDLTCTGGTLKILKCRVEVRLADYDVTYTGDVFTPRLEDAEISSESGEIQTNPEKFLELHTASTIRDAGDYTYTVRFIYGDYQNNFDLVVENTNGVGTYTVDKIVAYLENYAGSPQKTYDGKVYTLEKGDFRVNADTGLKFDFTLNDVSTAGADADNYMINLTKDKVYIFVGGENVTRNFDLKNEYTVFVRINQRAITYVLENYTCAAGSAPRYLTDAIKECLKVSSSTPLLNGFSISFDDDVINYNYFTLAITVEDFEDIVILNERGEDVRHNFYVTNGDRLTASVIER